MPKIDINTEYKMNLSLNSIEGFEEILQKKKKNLPQIAENIVQIVSEIGLKDNYKSVELLPIENNGDKIIGGIQTTDPKDTYREFGTGIVGSNNPHIADFLAEVGWKYDVNEHGEAGWIYPKEDGTFGWTKGIPADKRFYEAIKRMEESLPDVARQELNK